MVENINKITVDRTPTIKDTARRWNDLLDEFPAELGLLSVTAENLEQFQAALQRAAVSIENLFELQELLIRIENPTGHRNKWTNFARDTRIAIEVERLDSIEKKKGKNRQSRTAIYKMVGDDFNLTISRIRDIFEKSLRFTPIK